MKNVIARKWVMHSKDGPTHCSDSFEKGSTHLANIHKKYLLQLLKKKIANSMQYAKGINPSNEYNAISKLRLSPQICKRRSHSHIFQSSPKWQHNIIIRKCDYPNSKLEVVFRKGSICKGRPNITSQLHQRKTSEIYDKPNRELNRLINHKSTSSFDETVKNSDKSRNDEYEYRTNITDSIKFKRKLPRLMPRGKYNIARLKQRIAHLNDSELAPINRGWDFGRENIEFCNETLAIQ
jgi:hypothetical protein